MKVKLTEIQIPEPIRFGLGNLEEMKETLRKYGMIHPIAVKQLGKEGTPKYELLAGYLRYKAAESLGWENIEITLINPIDELNQFDLKIEENMKRRDLNPLELSELLIQRKRLWEEKNGTIKQGPKEHNSESPDNFSTNVKNFYEETSIIFKKSPTDIYRFLQLKELDPDLKVKVETGEMWYRKALEEQSARRSKNKTVTKKKDIPMPQPPIDLTWLSHDFQNVIWQMAGFYEVLRLVEKRKMNFTEIPEDQVLGMMTMSQRIQQWLQKFDNHIQEIMLQRTGVKT